MIFSAPMNRRFFRTGALAFIAAVLGMAGTSRAALLPNVADLIYNPITGNVTLDATEAAGGIISTFQLENFDATFLPANYIAVTGGTYNGVFKNITASVIGDTDFTFTNFSGIRDIGNVFPVGIADEAALTTYLKTRVYTGSLGSVQQQFDLVFAQIPEPATAALLLLGVGVLAVRSRRSRA